MEVLDTIINYYHYMVNEGLHPIRVIMRKDCYEEVLATIRTNVMIVSTDKFTPFYLMGLPVFVIHEGFYWKIETAEEENK